MGVQDIQQIINRSGEGSNTLKLGRIYLGEGTGRGGEYTMWYEDKVNEEEQTISAH